MRSDYSDVLLISIFLLIIKEVTGRHSISSHGSNLQSLIMDHLNPNSQNSNPLVVYISTNNDRQSERSEFEDNIPNTEEWASEEAYDDMKEAQEQAKYLLYHYLLTKSPERGLDPVPGLRAALRSRCQIRIKCETKCNNEDSRPKKSKQYCVPNCKKVFDKLNLCEPPKIKDPCADFNHCGGQKWGKTMPPAW